MSCVDEAPEGHRALQPLRHRGGHQGSHRQGLHYTYIRGGGTGSMRSFLAGAQFSIVLFVVLL